MKVYYSDLEQGYHPRHSFFCGRFTPYPDRPARTRSILEALAGHAGFELEAPPPVAAGALEPVHDGDYLEALAGLCARLKPDEEFFPFHMQRLPRLKSSPYPRIRMGYYALDGSTPLVEPSHRVALAAAGTALSGAGALAAGEAMAYALARPPGHHAGRASFAGYCLANNAALAAQALCSLGKVAILDVDYHHGNGSQEIFWERGDVLYISLHCRPEEAYPYLSGGADEAGAGAGRGRTVNLPLPGGTAWRDYAPALDTALEAIAAFAPETVVVSLGLDTLASDPIGTFALQAADFEALGARIAQLHRPLLVVQEGGYDAAALGGCVLRFFAGLGIPDARGGASGQGAAS